MTPQIIRTKIKRWAISAAGNEPGLKMGPRLPGISAKVFIAGEEPV
jgi:hypothetical protein